MKKYIVFSLFAWIVFQAEANHANSQLNFRLWNSSSFTVVFNYTAYPHPCNAFNFDELMPGYYPIQVFQTRGNFHCASNVLLYSGQVYVPGNALVSVMLDCNYRLQQNITYLRPAGGHCHTPQVYYEEPAYFGMHPGNFQRLKSSVDYQTFDNAKLNVAKQGIASNVVSSQQVKELVSLLTFEESKLNLAMFAYHYTVDKENYFIVNNAFDFSSSVDRLNRYIQSNYYTTSGY